MSRTLTRRRLLARGAAALAAGLVPLGRSRRAAAEIPGGGQRVAVIGAGLAGLAAAWELVAAGHRVTVFEARSRPGGRVRTLRAPFADGLYAEAGAMSVPAGHDLTLHYARLFELPLTEIDSPPAASVAWMRGRRLVTPAGEQPAWPVELTAEERRLGLAGMRERYWGRELAAAAESAGGPGWPPAALEPLDGITLSALWRRNGASDGAVAVLRFGYLDLLGDGVDAMSALNGLREAAQRLPGGAFRIDGGHDRLPAAFAAGLGPVVRYGAELVRLDRRPDEVRVTVRDAAGGTEQVTVDRVVCAIPFPLLRDVVVDPPFSDPKTEAIRGLRLTSVTRVFIQCRSRFWQAEGVGGNAMTDLPIRWIHHQTEGQPGPRAILETYATGPDARRLAALAPAERLALAIEQADRVLPGLRGQAEGGDSVCWDQERWARGAYAWFAPGETARLVPQLARPEGRIHFAGDHTSSLPGWMQGALASGRRAAAEI